MAIALDAAPAGAHVEPASGMSAVLAFRFGFDHPLRGLDHLLAMIAVGIVSALLARRALWAVPATFVAALGAGGVLSVGGLPLPGAELLIAASLVALGLRVLSSARSRQRGITATYVAVAVFGFAHGHAHGAEIPTGANAALYTLGFVTASAVLHVVGIGAGETLKRLPAVARPALGGTLAVIGGLLIAGLM